MDELTKCPKCKTRTLVREGDELVCSQCKEHFPAPTSGHMPTNGRRKKAKLGRSPQRPASRHAYFEAHKQEIIKDLFTYGRTPTRKKWTIPAGTLHSLEKRWLTPDEKAKLDTMTFAPPTNVHLPQTRKTIEVTYYRPGVYGVRPERDNLNFEYLLPTEEMMHETIRLVLNQVLEEG